MSAAPPAPGVVAAAPLVDPLTALLRRFAVDFLTGQSWDALGDIMAADYRLHVGGHTIAGRDEQYRPAMRAQFDLFPGLCVTVHDVVVGEAAIAMRFTEHGASRRDAGRRAAWQGVSLFRVEAGQLQTGWAEEDYIARKRQLRTGVCDPIEPPHVAPWDVPSQGKDPAAEAVARHWLLSGSAGSFAGTHGVAADPSPGTLIEVHATQIDELFSAGDRVVFHAAYSGSYAGGFNDVDASLAGTPAVLRAAGMLTVRSGAVVEPRVVTDRLGLQRALRPR